jgi:hypothetical protein
MIRKTIQNQEEGKKITEAKQKETEKKQKGTKRTRNDILPTQSLAVK